MLSRNTNCYELSHYNFTFALVVGSYLTKGLLHTLTNGIISDPCWYKGGNIEQVAHEKHDYSDFPLAVFTFEFLWPQTLSEGQAGISLPTER